MLDIDRVLREESVMKSLTGLQVRQFKELRKKLDAKLLSRKLTVKTERQLKHKIKKKRRNHNLTEPELSFFTAKQQNREIASEEVGREVAAVT